MRALTARLALAKERLENLEASLPPEVAESSRMLQQSRRELRAVREEKYAALENLAEMEAAVAEVKRRVLEPGQDRFEERRLQLERGRSDLAQRELKYRQMAETQEPAAALEEAQRATQRKDALQRKVAELCLRLEPMRERLRDMRSGEHWNNSMTTQGQGGRFSRATVGPRAPAQPTLAVVRRHLSRMAHALGREQPG